MNNEYLRYSKHIILDGFGLDGQEKIKNAKVLVIGAGGLGCAALTHLACSGVGTIGIADFDTVTLSNLNRQTLHITNDIGKKKAVSALEKIKNLNPNVKVETHINKIDIDNIKDFITPYDIVIDATDNATARYLISDCCYFLKKPVIEGGAVRYEGFLMVIVPDETACYRCLYPEPPKDYEISTCNDIGILGGVAATIGTLMALEAIKLIVKFGTPTINQVLYFDCLTSNFDKINITKNENCPLCGKKNITELVEYHIKTKLKIPPQC